jgi:hypothetical protein
MTEQVTLNLPLEVYHRARLLAERAGRPVNDLLAETIAISLRPLGSAPGDEQPLTTWTDEAVLAAAQAELPPDADQRLSDLLHRQQAGMLPDTERSELSALMELYQSRLLRKAQALQEAVRRGLRGPLQP